MRRSEATKPTVEATLADRFEGFVVDLDGVVWVGDEAVPGAVEALGELRAGGKRVVFLTNDPRSSRADYSRRLQGLGIAASEDEIVTSGAATADFLAAREEVPGRTAFVVGSPALQAEIRRVGLRLLDGEAGRDADFVVIGGHDGFNYDELRLAAQAVRRGARFYATGRDAVFPMPDGPWPGTGAVLAAVETAAGKPAIAVGKPEAFIFEVARARLGSSGQVAIVGDHLEADIAGGRRAGLTTILVLTGNARAEDVGAATVKPDFVVRDLAALVAPVSDKLLTGTRGQEPARFPKE